MLEDILILLVLGSGIFLVGLPFYKLVRAIVPHKRNVLLEAQERLEQARLDAEAAKLNKEAERLYEELYQESLEDLEQEQTQEKHK